MAFRVDQAVKFMEQAMAQQRLGHAYLVHGHNLAMMEDFSAAFLHKLLQVPAEETGPDLFGNLPPEPVRRSLKDLVMEGAIRLIKPESKSRIIKVEKIREMEDFLHLSDQSQTTKVAVISDADRLNVQAENAFLKTLEEPPERCLILLLSTQPERLLPTIHSRCIHLPLYSENQAVVLNEDEKVLLELLRSYFQVSKLSLPRALTLMNQVTEQLRAMKARVEKESDQALKEESASYQKTTDGRWLAERKDYYEALTSSRYLAGREAFLTLLMRWFGEALRFQQNSRLRSELPAAAAEIERLARARDTHDLLKRYRAVEDLQQHLQTNVHETLAMEVAFLGAFS